MKPGDLVRVHAENFYYGIGIIVHDWCEKPGDRSHYVLTSDGKCHFYFENELEIICQRNIALQKSMKA